MTEIFFHIGLHKTATTWFQQRFFPSLDNVRVLHTRHISELAVPDRGSPTLIVSHEKLSGSVSHQKSPDSSYKRLIENLEVIATFAPHAAIIVGFREHASWLQSAYSHKAKKYWGVSRESYGETFSLNDLSWCRTLRMIETHCPSVFPFLYEELSLRSHLLIEDLCSFIGKTPPKDLDQLLNVREMPSPRSQVGQLVARSFYALHYASGRMIPKTYSGRIGARFDPYFPTKPLVLNPDVAADLHQDWNELIRLIGKRRSRDFSALSWDQAPRT